MSDGKNFKVVNSKGEYLGFNFDGNAQCPYWDVQSMSYSFTKEKAEVMVTHFGGKVVES